MGAAKWEDVETFLLASQPIRSLHYSKSYGTAATSFKIPLQRQLIERP